MHLRPTMLFLILLFVLGGCGNYSPKPARIVNVVPPLSHQDNDFTGYTIIEVEGNRTSFSDALPKPFSRNRVRLWMNGEWGEVGDTFLVLPTQCHSKQGYSFSTGWPSRID